MRPRATKLLVATDVMLPGGVVTYVVAFVRALRAAGHKPLLVVEAGARTGLRAAAARERVALHAVRLYHRAHAVGDIARDCDELIDAWRPDGVHVACGIPWSCLTLREVAARRGMPLAIVEQYVPDDLELTPAQCERIATSYAHARRVVFVSEGNRRAMASLLDLTGVAHEVIPNGVPVDAIARRSPTLAVRAIRISERRAGAGVWIVTVARLVEQKGLDVLIDALALLPRGTVARVDVLGDGPLRPQLESRVREAGIGAIVRFRCWAHDVVPHLASHDLFVLPSRNEGMPFALLEAMAAGIPVVATDVPGSVEALADGRSGTCVPRADARALADAIAAAARDVRSTIARAAAAQVRARSEYDVDRTMATTIAAWHDAVPG